MPIGDDAAAYPFVVARNSTMDWRPLLAPAALIDADEAFALVFETGGAHPQPVTVRTWRDHTSTTWTLAYRSIPATPELVGGDDTQVLVDRFGRGLFLVEGVALPSAAILSTEVARQLVERSHSVAVAAFRDFWPVDDEDFPVRASPALSW